MSSFNSLSYIKVYNKISSLTLLVYITNRQSYLALVTSLLYITNKPADFTVVHNNKPFDLRVVHNKQAICPHTDT